MSIHPAALAFARVAASYERGRPSYPDELRGWLADRGELGAGRCIVDLGAGTGKLTRLLVGHGARVLAVEPLEEMRAELAAIVPQAEVVVGHAESIPVPSASANLVTCGQSFHWFANSGALGEIARVLVASGTLVVVWNVRDLDDPLQARLAELVVPERDGGPSEASGEWREVLEESRAFEADGELTLGTHQLVDRAALLDRVESTSHVAALAGPRRASLLAAVASLVPAEGRVRLAYTTRAYAFRRRDGRIGT